MTPTTDCDILETIADALTNKFKKELIANLEPYAERIRDGEKYQRVIKQLLETLPEYVELRDKYDSLLQENERLKSTPPCSQDNIVLDLTEPIASSEVRKVDLTNNIHMVCQTDENTIVNKVEQEQEEEQEELVEEESEDESEEESEEEEQKESTIVKREDHPENMTKDKIEEEQAEEQEEEQAEESEYEEVTDDEEQEPEQEPEQAEESEYEEEEQDEEESEYEEVTDDEAEQAEQEEQEPEQTKPTATGKRPVLARKVPIN